MLRIVITTTLISLSTPKPLNVIPLIRRPHETSTIAASNKLKPSIKKVPEDANVLRKISTAKMVRKIRSIVLRSFASIVKSADIVRSNKMKMEYNPIVNKDRFSMY